MPDRREEKKTKKKNPFLGLCNIESHGLLACIVVVLPFVL